MQGAALQSSLLHERAKGSPGQGAIGSGSSARCWQLPAWEQAPEAREGPGGRAGMHAPWWQPRAARRSLAPHIKANK